MNQVERSDDQLAITAWLTDRVAKAVNLPPASVDVGRDLVEYGLDSAASLELLADLEDFLGRELPATLIVDFRTIDAIATETAKSARP